MNKTFKFKKGESWDGDEPIFDYIQEALLDYEGVKTFPTIKQDTSIKVIITKFKEGKK